MQAIFNIINRLFAAIDRMIERMDKRTVDTIKQAAYLLAFIIIVASVGLGIYKGKEAARIGALPSFSSVNEIFETSVKQSRRTPYTHTMVESSQIYEIADPELRRILFPSQAGQEPTIEEKIVEPEAPHKAELPTAKEQLSEIERTDEQQQKADIKPLSKRETAAPAQVIPPDREEGIITKKTGTDLYSENNERNVKNQGSQKPIQIKSKTSPKLLDREPIVFEK